MATSRILSTYYIVLVFRSLVNPQYAPDRNHFPNTHRHAPSATTELCRRQHPALDFHNSTSTPQPQARAALCQKQVRTHIRCGATALKSDQTPVPGSAQRPSSQARSSAHNSNRLWGAHAAARAGASQALGTEDVPACACSSLRLAVISLPTSMVARTLFIK